MSHHWLQNGAFILLRWALARLAPLFRFHLPTPVPWRLCASSILWSGAGACRLPRSYRSPSFRSPLPVCGLPDGHFMATSSFDRTWKLWAVDSEQALAALTASAPPPLTAAAPALKHEPGMAEAAAGGEAGAGEGAPGEATYEDREAEEEGGRATARRWAEAEEIVAQGLELAEEEEREAVARGEEDAAGMETEEGEVAVARGEEGREAADEAEEAGTGAIEEEEGEEGEEPGRGDGRGVGGIEEESLMERLERQQKQQR